MYMHATFICPAFLPSSWLQMPLVDESMWNDRKTIQVNQRRWMTCGFKLTFTYCVCNKYVVSIQFGFDYLPYLQYIASSPVYVVSI